MKPAPSTANKGIFSSDSFRVGTLSYTRASLVTVMFWMLWADL